MKEALPSAVKKPMLIGGVTRIFPSHIQALISAFRKKNRYHRWEGTNSCNFFRKIVIFLVITLGFIFQRLDFGQCGLSSNTS